MPVSQEYQEISTNFIAKYGKSVGVVIPVSQ